MSAVIYSLIFRIGTRPQARFDFSPSPAQVNEDRRSLNRSVPLPHGSVYRGLNGEGLGSIQLEGEFGVRAHVRNGRSMTGDEMYQLLSDYISDYWTATKGRDYKAVINSRIEWHDWQRQRHLYVEPITFSEQRGPQNKVGPRKYSMQLESYGPIEDEKHIASLWPLNKSKETVSQIQKSMAVAVEKIEAAGKTLTGLTDQAKGLIRQNVLRPLKSLTGALETFTRGLTSVIAFPFQTVNALGNACVDTIESIGTLITAPAIQLIGILRETKRMANRLLALPEFFKDQFGQVAQEWSSLQSEPLLTSDTAIAQDGKLYGVNLGRKRQAIRSADVTGAGIRAVDIHAEDTLQRIAARELGDASRWAEIALLNQLDSNADISSLSSLLVPSDAGTTSSVIGQTADTRLSNDEKLYGRDLLLVQDADGKMTIVFGQNNDLSTVSGIDNLIQAVVMRQRIQQGDLLEDLNYGIRAVIGSSQAKQGADELAWSLRHSALTDPRVDRVEVSVDAAGNLTSYVMTVYPAGRSSDRPVQTSVRL